MKPWLYSKKKKMRKLAWLTLLILVGCAASSQHCWQGLDSIDEQCLLDG